MDAVGSDCQRDVCSRVDKKCSSQFPVLSSQFCDCGDGFACKGFQFAGWKILFAELDVVHSGADGFTYFFQETASSGGFVCGERGTVGDVVKKQAVSLQLSERSRAAPGGQPGEALPT